MAAALTLKPRLHQQPQNSPRQRRRVPRVPWGRFWRSFVFGTKFRVDFSVIFFFQGSGARQHFFWISCMWFQSSEVCWKRHVFTFSMGSWLDEGIFKFYKYGLKSVFPSEYSNFGCGYIAKVRSAVPNARRCRLPISWFIRVLYMIYWKSYTGSYIPDKPMDETPQYSFGRWFSVSFRAVLRLFSHSFLGLYIPFTIQSAHSLDHRFVAIFWVKH